MNHSILLAEEFHIVDAGTDTKSGGDVQVNCDMSGGNNNTTGGG